MIFLQQCIQATQLAKRRRGWSRKKIIPFYVNDAAIYDMLLNWCGSTRVTVHL